MNFTLNTEPVDVRWGREQTVREADPSEPGGQGGPDQLRHRHRWETDHGIYINIINKIYKLIKLIN